LHVIESQIEDFIDFDRKIKGLADPESEFKQTAAAALVETKKEDEEIVHYYIAMTKTVRNDIRQEKTAKRLEDEKIANEKAMETKLERKNKTVPTLGRRMMVQ
jgi:hypothetical protein